MLGEGNYSQDYVDDCRKKVAAQVAAYRKLAKAAGPSKALDDFESVFFNNMVLVLDTHFTHRLRGKEGKDGNPLNEVRVLCASLTGNGDIMSEDKTIKMKPETSVLHHEVGDPIRLTEKDFVALAAAFLAEIEAKFL